MTCQEKITPAESWPLLYSAREIAGMLPPDEWQQKQSGDAYLGPQRRVTLRMETNTSFKVLAFEEHDPKKSSEAMVDDILAVIGDHLCPQDMMSFVVRFADELTKWQVSSGRQDDWVGDEFRDLLARHMDAKAGK